MCSRIHRCCTNSWSWLIEISSRWRSYMSNQLRRRECREGGRSWYLVEFGCTFLLKWHLFHILILATLTSTVHMYLVLSSPTAAALSFVSFSRKVKGRKLLYLYTRIIFSPLTFSWKATFPPPWRVKPFFFSSWYFKIMFEFQLSSSWFYANIWFVHKPTSSSRPCLLFMNQIYSNWVRI